MRRSLTCAFLTHYTKGDERRTEFVYAVKNCRNVRKGRFSGLDGREVALKVSRRRAMKMRTFFEGAILVPVPPSGMGVDRPGDNLWSGRDLARMLANEYGAEHQELLRRHTPIQKSSSGPGLRQLRRHVDSVEVAGNIPDARLVLIDDVVASGSTMCGCVEVLLAAAPHIRVDGFAAAYVSNDTNEPLRDFAARQYEWDGLDSRPHNRLVPSPLSNR